MENTQHTHYILYTIGFGKKSAEDFFTIIRNNHVKHVIDVRLSNTTAMAFYTMRRDFPFLLKEICQCDVIYMPQWAPTKNILENYKAKESDPNKISWEEYEREFINIMNKRHIENSIQLESLNGSCLLCSEPTPEHCHRRLLAEYFQSIYPELTIKHL